MAPKLVSQVVTKVFVIVIVILFVEFLGFKTNHIMIGILFLVGLFFSGMVNGQYFDEEVKAAVKFYKSFIQECVGIRPFRMEDCEACLKKEFDTYDRYYVNILTQIRQQLPKGSDQYVPNWAIETQVCLSRYTYYF